MMEELEKFIKPNKKGKKNVRQAKVPAPAPLLPQQPDDGYDDFDEKKYKEEIR